MCRRPSSSGPKHNTRRMPVDLLVEQRSDPCVAGSKPAPLRRVAQEKWFAQPRRRDQCRRIHPANADRTTGQSAGTTRRGAVRLCAPSNRLAHETSCQTLSPDQNKTPGRMPKGLQLNTWRSGGMAIPTRRPGFGTDRTVSSPLSHRSRLPRRMPCGITACCSSVYQSCGRGFKSRRARSGA
jgi:hypothetical protein